MACPAQGAETHCSTIGLRWNLIIMLQVRREMPVVVLGLFLISVVIVDLSNQ